MRRYLDVAAMAYDAVFEEMRSLTPLEKHEKKADGRHGGMLDLPHDDPDAFERWYRSSERSGAHPWEIVFAHPHGILLSPHAAKGEWRFFLSVNTLGLYSAAARMAIALGEADVPFELHDATSITSALRGEDRVEIGPFYDQISLEDLEERRAGASASVDWDPPPTLALRRPESNRGEHEPRDVSATQAPLRGG